jgi:transcriptional regulator with XRE-family HTH domain
MIDRNQFYIELGARLRAKRETAGLKQSDIAEAVGISRTSLTNIECGRQRLLVDQLSMICTRLGTSPEEIIPGEIAAPKSAQARLAKIPVVANFLNSVKSGQHQ